jgi:hypothetical protein
VPYKVDLKVHVGWKVFRAGRGLLGLHYDKGVLKTGRWLRAKEIDLGDCLKYRRYPSGFHIFNSKNDAEDYATATDGGWGKGNISRYSFLYPNLVVRQVKYRGVLAEGTHFVGVKEVPGVVARWMWIPRSEKMALDNVAECGKVQA